MDKTWCEATVMGHRSGADSRYRFQIEGDPMTMPADEVVEALMDHLRRTGIIGAGTRYELNSAIRNAECGVVLAVGTLLLKQHPLPFAAFISKA